MSKSNIHPYQINVPSAKIDRLKQKLSLYDLPAGELPTSESPEWSRGPPLSDITRLASYWRDGYEWRAHEKRLNESLPQFMTNLDLEDFGSFDIHFVHARASIERKAIPLLFAHGWPGNFLEVSKILPLLVEGGDGQEQPVFNVVAPSLVDFGFSGPSRKAGFSVKQHGEICHKLMIRLGYDQYVVQGGDLGYGVARYLALTYPQHCKAHHINLAVPGEPTAETHPELYAKIKSTPLTDYEKRGIARGERHVREGGGYMAIQNTRPQTIGIALSASPVALLAWIYDKLHAWTDEYPWTDDEILTWISIYEFSTAGAAASVKIYYDENHSATGPPFFWTCGQEFAHGSKLGISRFPKELNLKPKLWHHVMGEIVLMKEHDKGGHFAAYEVPESLVGDLREMFGRGGGAAGCVEGRSGFEGDEEARTGVPHI